jgi:predicted TIM-barrel fold metal-dependent hydrolase
MDYKPISADSHVTEPPNCYIDFIDPAFRARAPHLAHSETHGDIFVIEGLAQPIPMGLIAAAGRDPKDLRWGGARFEELHRGGWEPSQRLIDQDRDGVAAELLYPTVGMMLCNHPDFDYKAACFTAYNRWLQTYCAAAPGRLFGLAQTAMRSVAEGIADLEQAKAMAFVGMMMPGNPQQEDYDHPIYDPFYEAAVTLDMPLSFHILTSRADQLRERRGPRINSFLAIIRGCQDIIGTFIFGGVFERHPGLKLVCVEADAGWAPHYMYRMDHAYKRHRYWLKCEEMKRLPSEYFAANVYLTFQDDWTAFDAVKRCNPERLMWANDFPHSDSTWPWSQEILARHTSELTEATKRRILRDNVVALYKLDQRL